MSFIKIFKQDLFLTVFDVCFSLFLVSPCVVGYWRSLWMLLDLYFSTYFLVWSPVLYLMIGFVGQFVFIYYQNTFKDFSNTIQPTFFLISVLYTFLYTVVCIVFWEGVWELLDIFAGIDLEPTWMTCAFSVLFLVFLKVLNNALVSPIIIIMDGGEGHFHAETLLKSTDVMEERKSLFVLDCLFSIAVVGTLVVFVWRGVWLLVDLFLFPEDLVFSYWCSLVIGYACVAIAFLLQPVMRYLCERLTGAARLLLADLYTLFALFGTVNVWRGIWSLLNVYFLPDNLELSCWITHWVSLIILILCRCSNSLLVRGVYIDAEEPGGECAIFPCYYLRIILRKKKLKKLNLNAFTLNDTLKVHQKDGDPQINSYDTLKVHQKDGDPQNNHVININTISNTVEGNNDLKVPT